MQLTALYSQIVYFLFPKTKSRKKSFQRGITKFHQKCHSCLPATRTPPFPHLELSISHIFPMCLLLKDISENDFKNVNNIFVPRTAPSVLTFSISRSERIGNYIEIHFLSDRPLINSEGWWMPAGLANSW